MARTKGRKLSLVLNLANRIAVLERDRDRLTTVLSIYGQAFQYFANMETGGWFPTVSVGQTSRTARDGAAKSVLAYTPSTFPVPRLDYLYNTVVFREVDLAGA